MRSVMPLTLLVCTLASACGGGGGGGGPPPVTVGSLRIAWDYSLTAVSSWAYATGFYPFFDDGITDFLVEVRNASGPIGLPLVVQQDFGYIDMNLGNGSILGSVVIDNLPPGMYTVRFLSGTVLEADVVLRDSTNIDPPLLFTLELPQSYQVQVVSGQEAVVVDEFEPYRIS